MRALVAADPVHGVAHMLSHPFLANALLAGTFIALAAGLVSYFLVLRSQVFTGDALSHVAFTGALAALALGVDLRLGLFVGCIMVGLGLAGIGRLGRADDVVIGSVFAWVLGLGVFFLTVYTTSSAASRNSTAGVTVLFGSIYGLSAAQARLAAAIATAVALAVLLIARPLLFASIDEAVAAARGVPVRLLGVVFLALVGATAAEATQAVGALLLLGLLAAPAGAAQRLTDRPFRALGLSALLSLASLWLGLGLAYAAPRLPPSFAILAVAVGLYLVAMAVDLTRRRMRGPTGHPAAVGA